MNPERFLESPLYADTAYINGNWKYYTMDTHSHGLLEVNYIDGGGCTYEIDGIPHRLSSKNLILLDSSIPHKMIFDHGRPCTVMGVSLSYGGSGGDMPGLCAVLRQSPEIRSLLEGLDRALVFPDGRSLQRDILRLAREFEGSRDAFYLNSLSYHLLAEIARLPQTEASSVEYYVEKTRNYIREAFYRIRSNEQIAAHIGLNATYLERIYKRTTGKTLWESVTDCRLAAAEELLMQPAIPIGEIDSMIGFANRQTFYLQFKKHYGVSPSRYRKARREMVGRG